jgi:hypothetical protein
LLVALGGGVPLPPRSARRWTVYFMLCNAETREECEAYVASLPEPFRAMYEPLASAEHAVPSR